MGSEPVGIGAAEWVHDPWPHLEFDEFLRPDIAQRIASGWPESGWQWLRHSDITRPDGTSLRRYQFVEQAFPDVAALLKSRELEDEFRARFEVVGPLYPIALLVEDAPGYRIRRHTDCAGKVISAQVYFADDVEHTSSGVMLQTQDGSRIRQVPYLFNRGYAFRVSAHSWHRVLKAGAVRKSIQLIYYSTPTPNI